MPKINPDESSSSSGEEVEPPVQLPRRSRRASSITRAGNLALSLSSTNPSGAAPAARATNAPSLTAAETSLASASGDGRVRLVTIGEVDESVQSLLPVSPAYPSGVGGRMTIERSGQPLSSSTGDITGGQGKRYRMVFNDESAHHHLATVAGEPGYDAAGPRKGLPVGLEAVPDEDDPTMLCVRELRPVGSSGSVGVGGVGRTVARIKARPTLAGGRESIHSVMLMGGGDAGEDDVRGELMAVRVSTRLAEPREVQAVLLLPRGGEGVGREPRAQGRSGWVSQSCADQFLSSHAIYPGGSCKPSFDVYRAGI